MKRILYIIPLFIINFLFSQKELSKDYSYTVSSPYKVFDAKQKVYFSQNNQSIAIKFDGREVLIQKFDSEKPAYLKGLAKADAEEPDPRIGIRHAFRDQRQFLTFAAAAIEQQKFDAIADGPDWADKIMAQARAKQGGKVWLVGHRTLRYWDWNRGRGQARRAGDQAG